MGFANLFVMHFSMAASNFLGTKAEYYSHNVSKTLQNRHIDLVSQGEKEEVKQIFEQKGFLSEDLLRIESLLT